MGSLWIGRVVVVLVLLILASLVHISECQLGGDSIQFNSTAYSPAVFEEQPVGTHVVTIGAFYIDSADILRTDGSFTALTGSDAQYFMIETSTTLSLTAGAIRTATIFDRDATGAQTEFVFSVAYETPSGSSLSTQVRVTLDDVNDNPPRFTERVFTVALFEGTRGGTPFFNVTATDPDLLIITETIDETTEDFGEPEYTVDNGRIIYTITGGNELGHFVINTDNGTLSVSSGTVLDIDSLDFYNLTVMAVDGGGLMDIAEVLVTLLDSNDNQPQIFGPRSYQLTISEDTSVGFVILDSINASDPDRGLNADIQFLIASGDVTNSFSIDGISGEIVISSTLDRERGEVVNLTVAARDHGVPPLQDTINVVISLLDVNDYVPSFSQTSYELLVNENVVNGTRVGQVEADDRDQGPNGTVAYRIIEGAEGKFTIDIQTGEIFTNGSLDREEVSAYALQVEAVDNPDNSSLVLSSVVNVTIRIGDRNDNPPIFEQSSYEVSILDSVRRFTEIIHLRAFDQDSGSNGRITYRFEVPDPTNPDHYAIDANTGVVTRFRRVDFETQSEYTYTVRALDGAEDFPLGTDVQLTIYVHNVNENPPVFEQQEYNTTIVETTEIGVVVLTVTADDPDVGAIGEVRYRIISEFDAAGSFEVNETTGVVYVNSTLDFDFRDTISFQVEAYDGGFPEPFTDIANVTVFLRGENDEAPSIVFPEGFQIFVPENEPPVIEVIVLSQYTFDPDLGAGGEFEFGISQIYDTVSQNDSFAINSTNGLITSLRMFDREEQPDGVIVAIETTDFGRIPQSKVTNITILIGDKNDHAPYFESNISATVYELMPSGEESFAEYRATDDDIGSNSQLKYDIYAGDEFGRFSIDNQTGSLFTAQVLNKTVQQYYNLTIIALDRGIPQMRGFGEVFVEVLDANDQTPIFSESVYTVSFPEASAIGTTFLQVNATDSDIGTNADFQYFLGPNNSYSDRFGINSTSGEVYTSDMFDRENVSSIELTVLAIDDGVVPLTGIATIQIYINDSNDNTPVFNESVYHVRVVENAPIGTSLLFVFAYDVDAEYPNNAINYSLSGNRSEAFRVDPETGELFVGGEVDWEEGANFTIIAIATDLGEPSFFSTAEILVIVEDVNDQPPVFVPSSLNLGILENSEPGMTLCCVEAIDPDSAGNNSEVSFSVRMDFTSGMFQLDEETGLVTFVYGTLNRETRPSYDLLIRASDQGSPPQHTDANLTISILDANDFNPVFDQSFYNADIAENVPVGTPVITVQASDMDVGTNAELRYSIIYSAYFAINATTGTIFTTGDSFDFESTTSYTFNIFVTDLGAPPRNTTATVRVEITDFNDHRPVFEQSEYSATLRENLASGTTILQVSATDADVGTNAMIEYSLKEGEGSRYFGIDSKTGVLYTASYINREVTPQFNLMIIANNSAAGSPSHSDVQVNIVVTDLNDMHPSFSIVTEINVPEDAAVNSTIYTLIASDGDEELNGTVTYAIHQGNEQGIFSLNPLTGEIVHLSELDFETKSLYLFSVVANDSGSPSLSGYTDVLIRVMDSNDHSPYFTSSEYRITVSSEASIGTTVVTVAAFDEDEGLNGQLTYTITSGNDLGLFELVSSSEGSIRTLQPLRSFAGQNLTLTIQAADPNFSAASTVIVYAQPIVSTLPYFEQLLFATTISEDANSGTEVLRFSSQNAINYQIESGDVESLFSIDSSGILTLASSQLDFESRSLYQLTIGISNSAADRAFTVLNISIVDVNEFVPEFVSNASFVAIPETTPVNEPFFTVVATDRDGSSLANTVMYSLTSGTTTFQINTQTGELSLSRVLNYEDGDHSFFLTVRATNGHFSAEATVEIVVLNGNNYEPEFSQSSYSARILENASVGLNIVNVSASDQDMGSQGEITYGLHGDHGYIDFSIDTYTGQIFINSPLDYERQNRYVLEVVASDGGNPNQFSVARVRVFLEDLNDNVPEWKQVEYTVNVLENAAVGTPLIQVTANDTDQVDFFQNGDQIVYTVRNGLVTYSISDGDPENQFDINVATGVITIASSLNREEHPDYRITLNATDGDGQFTNAFLNITVHDINDQVPSFDQNRYVVGLPEDSENGTLVIQVVALDTDLNENSIVVYRIEDGNINDTFLLNSSTGEIWMYRQIDRETIQSYTLAVEAVDMGIQPLTGTTLVQINVLDINEHPPQFDQEAYVGEVAENAPALTSILQVGSSDLDFGENATVLFSVIAGNELDLFDINASTGVIFVTGSIDFEISREYDLVVMATDSGPPSERLSSIVNVTISVLDENDNHPRFTEESYAVYVSEAAVPGEVVLSVNATDADSGTNAEFVFQLDFRGSLESETNFVLDSATGTIVVSNTSNLDRETTMSYSLLLNVTDFGEPPLHSSVSLMIVITDSNDNIPQFVQHVFEGRLHENMLPGTSAARVNATDADEGSNAEITYKVTGLIQNAVECTLECRGAEFCSTVFAATQMLPIAPPFYANNQTGDIFSAEQFDRENVSDYVIVVTASDSSENDTQLSNTTCVHVIIRDQNDQYPLFDQTVYVANISEYTQPGISVVQVFASDADSSTNAEITYRFLTESGSFTINPSTGEILTLGVYDRETTDLYNLTVEARDRGDSPLSTTAIVIVTILDENDSPPVFPEPFYSIPIEENIPLGSPVLLLNVTDLDINENAEIVFQLEESIPANHFSINSSSGLLQTTQTMDRESIPSYLLTIVATDAGTPPLSSMTQVNITVLDANDLAPEFIGAPYNAQVEENTLPVVPIGAVQGRDGDLGLNAVVFFNITNVYPTSTAFMINRTSGEVLLRAALDAEASLYYNITIAASNGPALPEQHTETVFVVEVLDQNDNTPQFRVVDLIVTISEETPIGDEVARLVAVDLDATATNSEVTYRISGGRNTSLFEIERLSGAILVAGLLDREMESVHLLEVTVSDSGIPTMNATTTVTIILQDSNDNVPVFEQTAYLFSIQENQPQFTTFGQIRANDIDLDNISYFISGNNSLDGAFFVTDSTTGEMSSAAVFDREMQDTFSFFAIATDNGVSVTRTGEVVVNVTILDENDVTPAFSENVYNVSWYENTTVGAVLLTIDAFDPDLGRNGTLAYSILPSNDSSFFSINSTSGDIFLDRQFDREMQDWFRFYVTAHDFGSPSLTGTAAVQIEVLDNNDEVPVLNSSQYLAVLPENTPVGTTVIYIGASDLDINQNARLQFSLSQDFNGTFAIAAVAGTLTLTKSLDYEFLQNYSFSVSVQDSGENPLQTSSVVSVDVVDLNDNPPVFDSNVYSISVPENSILNTPIFEIPATDSDSTSNSELRYTILAGNLGAKFAVGETSGVISVARYLDREIIPFYTLSLQVVDGGIPQFTASTELEISVSDVNDHPPQFGSKTYSIPVAENTRIGTTIFTVHAEDADAGANANLSFTITSGNTEESFEINPFSGDITVIKLLDFETTPAYSLTVLVTDNGAPLPQLDSTTVRISITDTNEHPPTFEQNSYTVSLSEDAVAGTPIGYFLATDMDIYSGIHTYSLREENVSFIVDSLSGTVFVSGALQPSQYNLTLVASDGMYTTSVDIQVFVSPTTPVVIPPSFYFEVSEAAELDTTIGELPVMNVSSESLLEIFQVYRNGRISLVGPLDREYTNVYVFNVMAESGIYSPTYHIVTINVLDYNDFTPVFESLDYAVLLPELTPVGTTVLTLKAFDLDPSGQNSNLQINISSGNEDGMFALDPSTGALTVARMLNYELQTSFILIANVSNHLADPELYSTCQINISVADQNDNDPEFSRAFYRVSIPESTPTGTDIIVLVATDIDSGTNSELVFSIAHLEVPFSFTINQSTGAIATNTSFNLAPDVSSVFEVSAVVADRGNPQPRSDVAMVFVEVVPDNTYSPRFSQTEGYATEIPETFAIGGSVLQVTATDPDSSLLVALTFSFESGNSEGKFEIDPASGLITLASNLDFLEQSLYLLTVEAVDFGTPSRSSRVNVNISVIDINNHNPQFDQAQYEVAILENVTVGTSVVLVHASDPDASSIMYTLTVNAFENETQLFNINSTTGEIYTAASIDREFADSLQLLVSAIDSGYPIQRSLSVPVTVVVQDLNDNPPEFAMLEYNFAVVGFLAPGQFVGTVTATDADLVGQELEYSVTVDNSGGLFQVNSSSGELTTASQVPEDNPNRYELTVTAYDGIFTARVPIHVLLVSDGSFCEDGGFCTDVSPRNCTYLIFPFNECEPFCVGGYELSPDQMLCLSFYCLDTGLVPCDITKTCIPPNEACAGLCPTGMSVCPTTNICHPNTLPESCDGSNEVCLVGQTLVQRTNGTRYCTISEFLPTAGQTCVGERVIYCEALDECSNISAPFLCQACPNGLFECPDTNQCVPNLAQCCGFMGYYCEILNACMNTSERCELPNIAPVVQTGLIYLETIASFDADAVYSDDGHVIGLILGNGTLPGVDSQGEELSIAIVETSQVPESTGEWQYALCSNNHLDLATACSSVVNTWVTIGDVSETRALILPNTARIRFVRKVIEFDGAVWMRVKLWDGNLDGYLSHADNLVRMSDPHFDITVPFRSVSPYSEATTLITILVQPLITLPTFSSLASLQFSDIQEDARFVENRGNTIAEIVVSIQVPNFRVLPEDRIEGFPAVLDGDFASYEALLPDFSLQNYFNQVRTINPTRLERQDAVQSSQYPGVGVGFDATSSLTGTWQVTSTGDSRRFIYLDSVVNTSSQILLLNTTARLRYLPHVDFCGEASIRIRPWDGFWNETVATRLENGYIVTSSAGQQASLSSFNLNEWEEAEIRISCVHDKPVVSQILVVMDPIPYRITYRYERFFTVLVARETNSLRAEQERFSDFLQLILQQPVDIRRFSPANSTSTYVSFSVEDSSLAFEDIERLVLERHDTLSELNLQVLGLSQDATYGPGAGCSSSEAQHYHGMHINTLTSQFASDGDSDYLGMAVVADNSLLEHGVWQYYRGDWSSRNFSPSEYDADSSVWVNFPSHLSETRAFLLHGNDRIRFLPRPSFYWQSVSDGTNLPPSIHVKVWDNSMGNITYSSDSEILLTNINTNPFVDTLQSLTNPVGLFSDDIVTIEAARFGCDGVVNSGVSYDACCVCGGNGAGCVGCNGQRDSNAIRDACDICGGDDTLCLGCDLIPFSRTQSGSCGECISIVSLPLQVASGEMLPYPTSSFLDCNRQCYGSALTDECGVCSGGDTSHRYNSDKDCTGECFGAAIVDDCLECTGPGTGFIFNQNLDCTNVCGGSFAADSCGICQLPGEEGGVVENRDCAGVCFGNAGVDMCGVCHSGTTNISANSTVDECGICNGDNSTCLGCDGVLNSGRTVDRCGFCGGNNCGCFKVDFISPSRGPRTGGTTVTVHGAGFFQNDSSLLGFSFNPESENCGAPYRDASGESIPVTCRFVAAEEQLQAQAIPIDQNTIQCVTEATNLFIREFSLQVRIANGAFSNEVIFHYDDYSGILIYELAPNNTEIDQTSTITFVGQNFINSSVSTCLISDFSSCIIQQGNIENPLAVPATYINSSMISCQLPAAEAACRVTIKLSFDGQESGAVVPGITAFQFTYLFSAPVVQSIHFSNDLSELIVQFDRQVEIVGGMLPTCQSVFREETYSLLGGPASSCDWSDNRQQEVTVSLSPRATVQIGSQISISEGVIQTLAQLYSYTVSSVPVLVGREMNAVQPVAILTGPSSIPACGQANFTALDSLYPGYGGFKYSWSVYVEDSSIGGFETILTYLDGLSPTSVSVSLDAEDFVSNLQYYLELQVVNSIGLQSEAQIQLLEKDSGPAPQVYLLGPPERIVNAGENVLVESQVNILQCAQTVQELSFNWQLCRVVDERQQILTEENLSGVRSQSADILIPAEHFITNTSYILKLTVTPAAQDTTTVNITITVLPSSLQARVHGGNRVVSQSRTIVLDGRTSHLIPNIENASFVWSCRVVGTLEPCYNQSEAFPVPVLLPRVNFTTVPAKDLRAGTVYNFTLTLIQGSFTSYASTTIEITPSRRPPIVEILIPNSDIVSSQVLTLQGLVYSTLPLEDVHWDCQQLPGQSCVDVNDLSIIQSQTSYSSLQQIATQTIDQYSDIPLAIPVVTNDTNRANLVLKPDVLDPGARYTFRLSATNSDGTAYSQVTVSASSPPRSAAIVAEPLSGTAMDTNYVFTISGAIDHPSDSPFLYQFGLIQDQSPQGDENIRWISGLQTANFINTILPSGDALNNYTVGVRGRIFDRNGGFSDVESRVTVHPSMTTSGFYMGILADTRTTFDYNKDWAAALSKLMATALDINMNANLASQTLKAEALDIFIDVFSNHLPATQTHYALAVSLLEQITSNNGITGTTNQRRVTEVLTMIVDWFRSQSAVEAVSTEIPSLHSEQPVLLLSNYKAVPHDLLTTDIAQSLLSSWVNMLQSQTANTAVAQAFVQNTESISYSLCQQSVLGENALTSSIPLADLYVKTVLPIGAFNVSNNFIDFGSSLLSSHRLQTCTDENTACSEACFQGTHYPYDLFADPDTQTVPLGTASQERLLAEIEGSDPSSIRLVSGVTSVVISIPSTNSFLDVTNLRTPIQVLVQKQQSVPNDGSRVVCLYRSIGGSSGFERFQWELDTSNPPSTMTVDSTDYFVCEFTHLSEFAIGLLAPPVITEPPVLTTSTSQVQTTSSRATAVQVTSRVVVPESPTAPFTVVPVAGFPGVAVAIPLILIVLVAILTAFLVVLCLIWKKKRQRKVIIHPEERPEATESVSKADKTVKLKKVGPLTPEESKVPMDIIQLLDSGERTVVGSMNVLPSIRLRELRYQLGDNFGTFKNHPFYFLNRQLCEIEPAAEQQQFVSLVFGNKPIYVRKVTTANELTRHHFCTCGNAAQFECSKCNSQGYCSPECQYKDWSEQHQKECNRLSEKRRRSEILLKRQSSTLSPIDELPRRATIAGPPSVDTQPTSPTDWKTFLTSSKPFQQPPLNLNASLPRASTGQRPIPRTTLGQLAAQPSLSITQEGVMPIETPVDLSKRPVAMVSSAGTHPASKRQLPPLSRPPSIPRTSRQFQTTPRSSFVSPSPNMGTTSPFYPTSPAPSLQSSLQSSQPLFTAPAPSRIARAPFSPGRQLSIHSIGSEDLAIAASLNRSRDLRNQPILEIDEENYESSIESVSRAETPRSNAQDARTPSVHADTRPPSLAVRKKLGQASRASDRSHSEDSTSSSDSESEDSSSGDDSEPVTPTTPRKSASRRTDKDSGSTSQPRETSHDPETQLPPLQDANSHTSS